MKFNLGIKLYLLKEEFTTENEEELLKQIHDCVVDSVENKNEVLRTLNTKICLLLNIQSTREHVIHVKKISDIIAPLESKSIQILIEEDKILESFYKLDITETLIESYRKVFADLIMAKDKDSIENMDEEEERPPTNYGDQSYDQRTCIYVLNRETLEREYNMTQMNFFNSNFFNAKPSEINNINNKEKGDLRKKDENEVFATEEQNSNMIKDADNRNMVNNIDMSMPTKRLKEDNNNMMQQMNNQMGGNPVSNMQNTGMYDNNQNQMNNNNTGNNYDMKQIENMIQKTSDQKAQEFIDGLLKVTFFSELNIEA